MNILITSGGTSEKIDDVRHLTNHATGRLGKEIALALQDELLTIHYVHGPQAILPDNQNCQFYPISSVKELYNIMEKLLTTISFDYVIHSMAVSDYELDVATDEELLAKKIAEDVLNRSFETTEELTTIIKNSLLHSDNLHQNKQKKISSKNEKLILMMKKAPKIIGHIKEWQPNTYLIGFKLLVDVPEEKLVAVAQESIVKNRADLILANDLIHIKDSQHLALLVSKDGIEQRYTTKKEIAQGIKKIILSK